ncbi:hypothetical protein CBS147332_2482 [Penicillium roqueforti]|nr:hypothetical protein CBS147332_2482 [Penicillium roqueforti]KAI3109999.1 hypothetical protein CBS147331_5428 [Penicillium roqueforti]
MAMKHYYDKTHLPNQNLLRKLAQRFVGRFKVLERVGRLAYKLELPEDWAIHPVISVEYLEPDPLGEDLWERTPEPSELPPITAENVERVLDKRIRHVGRPRNDGIRAIRTEFCVRYTGYGPASDKWIVSTEPEYANLFASYDQAR